MSSGVNLRVARLLHSDAASTACFRRLALAIVTFDRSRTMVRKPEAHHGAVEEAGVVDAVCSAPKIYDLCVRTGDRTVHQPAARIKIGRSSRQPCGTKTLTLISLLTRVGATPLCCCVHPAVGAPADFVEASTGSGQRAVSAVRVATLPCARSAPHDSRTSSSAASTCSFGNDCWPSSSVKSMSAAKRPIAARG